MASKIDPAKSLPTVAKILLILFVAIIVTGIGYCGLQVHLLSDRQENMKKDYMSVNNISHGLLSVSGWKKVIASAGKEHVENFELTPEQNENLKKEIEQILHAVVNKAVDSIERPTKNIGKKIVKFAFNTFVSKKKIQQQVPIYSQKIINELNKPTGNSKLKNLAKNGLDSLASDTNDSSKIAETHLLDSIYNKYKVSDKAAFDPLLLKNLELIRKQSYNWVYGLLGGVILILLTWWFIRNIPSVHGPVYGLCIVSALILLAVGLTSTMIQIDARISSMNFHLLGQDVSYKDQVLFFQSKSIVDVVHILIQTGKIDSMIVGVMILIFSILFPVTKLLSTGIYMLDSRKWAKNKVIHYFAFESGKWGLADVLVIAILMTFIGFNGVFSNALSDMNMNNGTVTTISTNHTSMQPGYIIFISYVLYSFSLSYILKNISHLRNIILVDQK